MNKKNNGIIIGILIGMVIILVVGILLFKNNIVSFSSNERLDNNKNDGEKVEEDDLDNKNYMSIIDEYRGAINDIEFNSNLDKYPNINDNMMNMYHSNIDNEFKFDFKYVYYDINNDNRNELIVGNGKDIFAIYSYDGNKPFVFMNDSCLGERCKAEIYDNGMVYFYGAGGASLHGIDFYKVGSDGYSKDTLYSYEVLIDNNNITITDNIKKEKTDFTSDEDIIMSVKGDANKLDLSGLNWIVIE